MPVELVEIHAHDRRYKLEIDTESHIGGRIWRGGQPYEFPLLEDMYELGLDQATVVDVGAHIGNHSLWLAAVCGADVHAFEPDLQDAETLYRSVDYNDLHGQVCIYGFALGAESGHARSMGKGIYEVGVGPTEVRTLDSFGLEEVAMIKVDVEGMEPDVLEGAAHTLESDRPVVYAEAQTPAASKRNQEVLEPLGYRCTKRFDDKLVATPVERWDG